MQQEHKVFYSLSSPLVTYGLPSKYIVFVLVTNGALMLYIGILFKLFWLKIFFMANTLCMWQLGKFMTRRDPFWFDALLANLSFFKSARFLNNIVTYRA